MLDHHQPAQPASTSLRHRLQEHIDLFQDPILQALQGCGLSLLEAALCWIELGEQVQRAHDEALWSSRFPLASKCAAEAQRAARAKQEELAARIIAAKKEGHQ